MIKKRCPNTPKCPDSPQLYTTPRVTTETLNEDHNNIL